MIDAPDDIMLKANCRGRFTADDFQFVVNVLSKSRADAVPLAKLLADESTRDCVLDHDLVYKALLDDTSFLRVSPDFYFYVLTRRVLTQSGIDDRSLTDYIAAVLVEFGRRAVAQNDQRTAPLFAHPYISDLLMIMAKAGPWERLMIRAHVGDYSLFISGIFADRVRAQCELRGGPGIKFYEEVGGGSYLAAGTDRLADETEHRAVYRRLGGAFREVRRALNHLSADILHLHGGNHLLPHPGAA